mgnify:FL=1
MKSERDTEAPGARVLRDANVERAFVVLRRMCAPGTSESTAADVYRTLRARGLAPKFADEVPRYAMRKACDAAIGREDCEGETRRAGHEASTRDQDATRARPDSVSPDPDGDPVEKSPRASSTSPGPRFQVPKHQRYVPPVERLRATSTGARRAIADEIVRVAVDPVARAALRERVRAARDDACGVRVRTRIGRRKDEPSRGARNGNRPAEKEEPNDAASRAAEPPEPHASSSTSSVPSDVPHDVANQSHDRGSSTDASRDDDENERSARRTAPERTPPEFVRRRWRSATASAIAALEARDAEFSRRRRTRSVARERREAERKERKARFQNAVVRVQSATRAWLLRRTQRLAAFRVRAFLEHARESSEIVRCVRRLTRSVQTIQKFARAAFAKRAHPDQVAAFVEHWDVYERYVHATRLDAEARENDESAKKRLSREKGGGAPLFSVWNARWSPYAETRPQDRVPLRLKRPIVERVLRRRRETARRDRDEYRKALQAWRARLSRAKKLHLARAVLRPPDDDAKRNAFLFAEPPPRLRARRTLMRADELARAHAEGERAVQKLYKMDPEDEEGGEALAG